jgi:hypothetical protein
MPGYSLILHFKAQKKTWNCHWFPKQEWIKGGDPINNLFAKDGALDKLDRVTGGRAKKYEYKKNRKSRRLGPEYSWLGHDAEASEVVCILDPPKHSVVMTAKDGSSVTFSTHDIQGLLVKCVTSFVRIDFFGERYNPDKRSEKALTPELFLKVMQEWAKDGLAFVLGFDSGKELWNYPYDEVKIYQKDKNPKGQATKHDDTEYYRIKISSTGFEYNGQVYECSIKRDSQGAVVESRWIKTRNTDINPNFMWRPRPVGNPLDKSLWRLHDMPSNNPKVDPQVVYDIYTKSRS